WSASGPGVVMSPLLRVTPPLLRVTPPQARATCPRHRGPARRRHPRRPAHDHHHHARDRSRRPLRPAALPHPAPGGAGLGSGQGERPRGERGADHRVVQRTLRLAPRLSPDAITGGTTMSTAMPTPDHLLRASDGVISSNDDSVEGVKAPVGLGLVPCAKVAYPT